MKTLFLALPLFALASCAADEASEPANSLVSVENAADALDAKTAAETNAMLQAEIEATAANALDVRDNLSVPK